MSITLKEKTAAEIGSPVPSKVTLFVDSADEKLKKKLSDGTVVTIEVPAASVSSVFGREGVVVAEAGDYLAAQVTNVPAGDIISTNVQAAINELDAEKLPVSHAGSGGAAHALVDGVSAGFMSVSDKAKLDGIEAGADATVFSSAAPQPVGTALAGTSGEASRADHVHAHGNQTGETLHAVATTTAHGFMASSDKLKLDGIESGANATVISSSLPDNLGVSAPGVSSQVSRADHVHAHGSQAGGSLHDQATGSVAGFMSASDKTKIDGIEVGATQNQTDAYLLNRANHTGTQLASTVSDFSSAADLRIDLQKAVANGLATLGPDEKIPASQLPAVAVVETFVVNSEAEMLALDATTGDLAVRTDISKTFILSAADPTILSNWVELLTPGDDAIHVINGHSGNTVSLYTSDIPENTNLYYTDTRADSRITLQKGAPSGIATLDGSSLLTAAQHGSYSNPSNHAVVTTSDHGFMSSSDKVKLNGIEAGATQNQTDAYLLNRANHTGTQGASTIANLLGLSLPQFGLIDSADSLLTALAKIMSQGSLHPVVISQSMTVPSGYIYRRPQLTTLSGSSTKLSIVGSGRVMIRA